MPYELFISYSRRDNPHNSPRISELIGRIKRDFASFEGMQGRELRVFFDQDEIHGMSDWRQRILQGLRESRLLLACLSPAYLQSQYCEWEFVEYLKYEIGHLHGFNGVAPIYFVEVPGWESKDFEQRSAAWVAELRKREHFDLRPWHDQGEEALRETAVQERMSKLNAQIVQTITRGERAEKSSGNVDAHNPHFIGRTANLRMLRENFVKPGHIGVVTAVNGVGGLGKTALAIEYAHGFADEYGGGRWQVRCSGKDDLRLALAELATPIGFEFTDDEKKNADLQFERVRRELKKLADASAPHRCLLLLDNVDRPGLLDPAQVARLNGGDWLHILATTRLGENELHGAHKDRSFLAIDELPPDDALALIESYQPGGRFRSESERDAAREIVRLLGSFTLAVESAAVYLGQFANDVTCAAFLARLKKEGLEGLDTAASQSSEGVLHGEKRLSATLRPTLERLGAAEKLTLEFAALLPPDEVPLPWLRALVAKTFPEMERDAEIGNPDPWNNVARRLLSLRLLQATDADNDGLPRVMRVHRLVQEILTQDAGQRIKRIEVVLGNYLKVRADFLWDGWAQSRHRWEVIPLSETASHWMERRNATSVVLANQVSESLKALGNLTKAQRLLKRAVEIAEEMDESSQENPEVTYINLDLATGYSNLALVENALGNVAEAKRLMDLSIAIDQRNPRLDPKTLAIRYSNLGLIEKDMMQAQLLFSKAVKLAEDACRNNDPFLAVVYSNLAVVQKDLGNLEDARHLLEKAISIEEVALLPNDPRRAMNYSILGLLEQAFGNLEKAESLMRQSLETRQDSYNTANPATANGMVNLAMVLAHRGKDEEAKRLATDAIEMWQQTDSPSDPRIGKGYWTLGIIAKRRGNAKLAAINLTQALELLGAIHSEKHPWILALKKELAAVS